MPLISKYDAGGATLLLWRASETEEELRLRVSPDDCASADRFRSPKRRREHLAWRAALRTELPAGKVMYNETCAPFVYGTDMHIGVTHTGDCAAVLLSAEPCSLDMERTDRDFSVSAARFISEGESQLPDALRPDFPATMWCAKEALYKYSGMRELDFLKDLEITASDLARGTMTGRLCNARSLPIHVLNTGEYIIVYIL